MIITRFHILTCYIHLCTTLMCSYVHWCVICVLGVCSCTQTCRPSYETSDTTKNGYNALKINMLIIFSSKNAILNEAKSIQRKLRSLFWPMGFNNLSTYLSVEKRIINSLSSLVWRCTSPKVHLVFPKFH